MKPQASSLGSELPRTPEKSKRRVPISQSSISSQSSPAETPQSEISTVFSPQGSVISDLTDDDEWYTPTAKGKRPGILNNESLDDSVRINPLSIKEAKSDNSKIHLKDGPKPGLILSAPTRDSDLRRLTKDLKKLNFFSSQPHDWLPSLKATFGEAGQERKGPKCEKEEEGRESTNEDIARQAATQPLYSGNTLKDDDREVVSQQRSRIDSVDADDENLSVNQHKENVLSTGDPPSRQIGEPNSAGYVSSGSNIKDPGSKPQKSQDISRSEEDKKNQEPTRQALAQILPFEMHLLLQETSKRCVMPDPEIPESRCPRGKRPDPDDLLGALANMQNATHDKLVGCIKRLIHLTFCMDHKKNAYKLLKSWNPAFEALSPEWHDRRRVVPEYCHLPTLVGWIRDLGGNTENLRVSLPTPVKNSDVEADTILWRALQLGRSPKLHSPEKPKTLQEQATRPLKGIEISKSGLLYIFWQPNHLGPGYVKIGATGRDQASKRTQEWLSKCHISCEVLYPKTTEAQQESVQHVFRAEKLVHTELKDYRRNEIACPGCGVMHNEWFEIDKVTAIAAVEKWMEWLRQKPYKHTKASGWALKDTANLRELCQPGGGSQVEMKSPRGLVTGSYQRPRDDQ